jgi:putative ABC transport system permease protein
VFAALRHLTARALAFARGRTLESDFAHELEAHVAMLTDDNVRRGMPPGEARRVALIRVGALASIREQHRAARGLPALETLGRDVRYALRTLRRSPGFASVAILTLALGIGANSAVFSAIDAVLLQPLPYPDGDRLVRLRQRQPRSAETNIAPIRLEDWNRLSSTFEAITGYYMDDVSDTSNDLPEKVRRAWVAARFFDVWRVAPALGRMFTEAEHRAGGPTAVVISDRYWRRRLGADPRVLARTVRIGTTSFPIVGVMPASFLFPDRGVDLWMPVPMGDKLAQARVAFWYTGVGRLKQNVTVEQARANMAMVQMQLATEYPKTDAAINVDIAPLKDNTVGDIRASLWLLFAAVSVLLLVACTNIAALLLSRATDRKREMSVRRSLGATRWAIVRQALTETGVLALIGGAVGLLLAAGAVAALRSAAVDMPRMDEIALDGRIVLYTLVVVLTVTLLSGVLPAIRIARDDATGPASEAGRSLVTGRNSLQWLLVGAQITLSVTLLAAAGLFVRSFQELWRVDPGFDMSRVLTFRMSGSYAETNDYDRLIQRIDSTIDELRALPGIEAAATAVFLPGIPAEREANFELVEAPRPSEGVVAAESRFVSREYFTTMQIPVIAGDLCSRRLRNGPREVMVNRSFATRYLSAWPSPLGLHLKAGDTSAAPSRIIGIVGDARERGLDRDPGPTVYACFSAPNPIPHFLVRTHGEPLPAAETVRLKMKDLEPLRSVYNIAPLEHSISGVFNENRLRTMLLVLFAMTALSLSCVGLYSTLSYVVSLRRREVGLRLALGARPGDIVRQFVAKGVRVAAAACACGLVVSLAVSSLLSGMLYGVSPSDPVTLVSVIIIVLTVCAFAALVPATRAGLVEPMRVLREQ